MEEQKRENGNTVRWKGREREFSSPARIVYSHKGERERENGRRRTIVMDKDSKVVGGRVEDLRCKWTK